MSTRKVKHRSDRLLDVLRDQADIVVVTHNNPDPDAISSGWAIYELIRCRLGKKVQVAAGGDVLRAENRHMLELLKPPLQFVSSLKPSAETAIVLVDCSFGNQNHLAHDAPRTPIAVIDHHRSTHRIRYKFRDIRERVAATATITANYLREQRIEPGPGLATALLYAISTETCGGELQLTRLDRGIIHWLTAGANQSLLAEIRNAPLHPEYYNDLVLALQNAYCYGDSIFCLLPLATGPEIVAEIADLLIRCKGIVRVFCGAFHDHSVYISVRTGNEGGSATELILATLLDLGHGGGHSHRAGGRIDVSSSGPRVPGQLQRELRSRWLQACKIPAQRGSRLVSRQNIITNL